MVKCAKIFVRLGLFELIFLSFFFEGEKKERKGRSMKKYKIKYNGRMKVENDNAILTSPPRFIGWCHFYGRLVAIIIDFFVHSLIKDAVSGPLKHYEPLLTSFVTLQKTFNNHDELLVSLPIHSLYNGSSRGNGVPKKKKLNVIYIDT